MVSKIKYVCAHCGGSDVYVDAIARWNFNRQEWELFAEDESNAECSDCGGETSIEERTVEE